MVISSFAEPELHHIGGGGAGKQRSRNAMRILIQDLMLFYPNDLDLG
jgi:hypothetical protein